jgi:hypothetical protein
MEEKERQLRPGSVTPCDGWGLPARMTAKQLFSVCISIIQQAAQTFAPHQ